MEVVEAVVSASELRTSADAATFDESPVDRSDSPGQTSFGEEPDRPFTNRARITVSWERITGERFSSNTVQGVVKQTVE